MTTRIRSFLLAGAVCAGLAVAAGSASAATIFATPSLNIGCFGTSTDVRCDIRTTSATPPPKPRSCHFDWGTAYSVARTGKGRGRCVSDTTLPDPTRPPRILKYGTHIKVNKKITCISRRTGLTCRNTKGHGFMLSKQKIRLF